MEINFEDVEKSLTLIHGDRPFEIRILGSKIFSGYFDNVPDAIIKLREVQALMTPVTSGVYVTLQDIIPGIVARAPNRFVVAKHTTTNNDIVGYRWVLYDFDPVRPAGISSNDSEKLHAGSFATRLFKETAKGSIFADSGNGYHILEPFSGDGKTLQEQEQQVKETLRIVSSDDTYCDAKVKIDSSTFKPAQITKLYGTQAKKGFEYKDRVYRLSKILETN